MSNANDLIRKLPAAFVPARARGLKMTVQFMIDDPMYAVILADACQVHYGQAQAPDLVVTAADDDLARIITGEASGMAAFMRGRLKVKGDLINARKLPDVFEFGHLR